MQFEFWQSIGQPSQTSETCEPPTSAPTSGQPSSPQDTHASPSVLPGSAKARRMTATSGRQLLGQFKSSGLIGAFLKMFMGTSRWASTMCWLKWKASATPRGRLLFRLAPSMPCTGATVYGLWQTPIANDARNRVDGLIGSRGDPHLSAQVKLWQTPVADDSVEREKGKVNSRGEPKLSAQVKLLPTPTATGGGSNKSASSGAATRPTLETMARKNLWPTPRANDPEKRGDFDARNPRNGLPAAVNMFPTPTASDADKWSHQSMAYRIEKRQQVRLPTYVSPEGGAGGSLNPNWVEWLMGYPVGWTDLEPSETQSSHK